jgi:hypothetical protein
MRTNLRRDGLTAPGGPTITVVIRQGPMILNCCVCDASARRSHRVWANFIRTGDGSRPDRPTHRARCPQVGHYIEHVTTDTGQPMALDKLADGCLYREYAECPRADQLHGQGNPEGHSPRNVWHTVKGPDSPTGRALGQSHHSTEVFLASIAATRTAAATTLATFGLNTLGMM